MNLAIEHGFERRSVVSYRRLVAEALQNSLGDCNVDKVEREMASRDEILTNEINGQLLATTQEVVREEDEIIEFLDHTRYQSEPINTDFRVENPRLDEDQRDAVEALLHSTNRVFVIEGRAGTGKTTLMREAISGIEATGTSVFTFAPTSEASHKVLKQEGFEIREE